MNLQLLESSPRPLRETSSSCPTSLPLSPSCWSVLLSSRPRVMMSLTIQPTLRMLRKRPLRLSMPRFLDLQSTLFSEKVISNFNATHVFSHSYCLLNNKSLWCYRTRTSKLCFAQLLINRRKCYGQTNERTNEHTSPIINTDDLLFEVKSQT